MERIVLQNKKGMTLIEIMLALVLLLIVSLALMQTALVGIQTNMQNSARDEAVSVAEMRMNDLRNTPFDSLTATTGTIETGVSRSIRNFSLNFTPTRTIADINADTKQISISVEWTLKGKTSTHAVTTIVRRQ